MNGTSLYQIQNGTQQASTSGGTVYGNFPVAFSGVPTVVCTVNYNGIGYSSVSAMILNGTTASTFSYNVLFTGNNHTEQYCNVNWIAIY